MATNKRSAEEMNGDDGEVHDVSQTDESVCTENEEDNVVTMVDVLQTQVELEADANAVLGGADVNNCTYPQGYVDRQALYACKTCSKDDGDAGAVCVACSYKCHEGHDLIELYTKRNFRCDCGNALFKGAKCSLFSNKDERNLGNSYNHNFKGLYCVCRKTYPDLEDDSGDVMVQCILCEDWYHTRHLKLNKPVESDVSGDLICHLCMENAKFLRFYQVALAATAGCKLQAAKEEARPVSVDDDKAPESTEAVHESEAIFLPEDWRANLCKCCDCVKMYEELKVSFLMDEADSVLAYEERNKALAGRTQYERGMDALSSMDRVQQVEVIQSFNDLRTELMEHLRQFRDSNTVVTESDIRQFFSNMKAKRPRLEIPSTCR